MEGVSIVPSIRMEAIEQKIEFMYMETIRMAEELKEAKKPYLSTKEVCQLIGVGENWVLLHKDELGSSKKTGKLLFKRKAIEDFIEDGYFQIKSKNRYA